MKKLVISVGGTQMFAIIRYTHESLIYKML